MRFALIILLILSFSISQANVCEIAISSNYSESINELAFGYANYEKMKVEDASSEIAKRVFLRELKIKQAGLVAALGEEAFAKAFVEAERKVSKSVKSEKQQTSVRRMELRQEEKLLLPDAWTLAFELNEKRAANLANFSSSGKMLAFSVLNRNLVIWDAAKNRKICEKDLGATVMDMNFLSDDQSLLISTWSQTLFVDATNCEPAAGLPAGMEIQSTVLNTDRIRALTLSRGSSEISYLRNFDLDTRDRLHQIRVSKNARSANISQDGTLAVVSMLQGPPEIFDIEKEESVRVLSVGLTPSHLHFFNQDKNLVAISGNGSLELWDVSNGLRVGEQYVGALADPNYISLAISPDRNYVISGGENGPAKLWRILPVPALEFIAESPHAGIRGVKFSPDSKRAVVVDYQGRVSVFKIVPDLEAE